MRHEKGCSRRRDESEGILNGLIKSIDIVRDEEGEETLGGEKSFV
jgi:hypothetical protein